MALLDYYIQYSMCFIFAVMMILSEVGWASTPKGYYFPSAVDNSSYFASNDKNNSLGNQDVNVETSMLERHEKWMSRYGRVYKDAMEKEMRFKIFKRNVEYIESVNLAGERRHKLGVNKFADLTREELKNAVACYHREPPDNSNTARSSFRSYSKILTVPDSVDWRNDGAVTSVKDQLVCGSCWAFTATETTGAIYKIKKGELLNLSQQQLVDCDRNRNGGCSGGNPAYAFEDFIKNTGLTTEEDYPYQGVEGTCISDVTRSITISGYTEIPKGDETALLEAVVQQPVSAVIDVGSYDFYLLTGSDIFSGPCVNPGDQVVEHFVTIIGYGTDTESGKKYWLVKNQWGTDWGDNGYVRIERDVNMCEIASEACYPYIDD